MRNIISKVINLKVVLQCAINPEFRGLRQWDRKRKPEALVVADPGVVTSDNRLLVGHSGMPITHNARWRGQR